MLQIVKRLFTRPTLPVSTDPAAHLALRLQQECATLAALYQVSATWGRDPHLGWWVQTACPLPAGFSAARLPCLLLLPEAYPQAAPTALWLPAVLPTATARACALSEVFPRRPTQTTLGAWQLVDLPLQHWRVGDDLGRVVDALTHVVQGAWRLASSRAPLPTAVDTDATARPEPDAPSAAVPDAPRLHHGEELLAAS